jgi:uncharacterized membrane protein YgdD (TMEM256/DUF423 family)
MRGLVIAASVCGLLLVAAGAAGAHAVAREQAFPQGQWDSALLYGFVHTLAALLTATAPLGARLKAGAGWSFIAGVVLFSGIQIVSLLTSHLAGAPSPVDALSPLIPVGGVAFMLGWILLGTSALLKRPDA